MADKGHQFLDHVRYRHLDADYLRTKRVHVEAQASYARPEHSLDEATNVNFMTGNGERDSGALVYVDVQGSALRTITLPTTEGFYCVLKNNLETGTNDVNTIGDSGGSDIAVTTYGNAYDITGDLMVAEDNSAVLTVNNNDSADNETITFQDPVTFMDVIFIVYGDELLINGIVESDVAGAFTTNVAAYS